MLSYMLPVEEKPPPVPGKGRLQLELERTSAQSPPPSSPEGQSRRPAKVHAGSAISKESSTSSFASSDLTGSSMTPTGVAGVDKPKLKLLANGTKHTTLKRVSFGSSKGSMVETLIYEAPLQEEPEKTRYRVFSTLPFADDVSEVDESERSKVRVSFYQGAQAQSVSPPPAEDTPSEASLAMPVAAEIEQNAGAYNRQASTESGWDNPFRPDGDLSREADEIVNLIKGGQPITPTPGAASPVLQSVDEGDCEPTTKDSVSPSPVAQSPEAKKPTTVANSQATPKVSVNGTRNGTAPETRSPGQVDIQRTTPQEPQQAEHVVIKKKQRCKCCVIQ